MERQYKTQQACPVARSLDLVGERWTLLLVRDLLRGRSRFGDLLESLQGISPNLLSARLRRLEEAGIVTRSLYTEHPPRAEYHLTEMGEALRPVISAFSAWGDAFASRPARGAGGRRSEAGSGRTT